MSLVGHGPGELRSLWEIWQGGSEDAPAHGRSLGENITVHPGSWVRASALA